MAIADLFKKVGERSRNRKELIRDLDERTRVEEIVAERRKSANQRELERFLKEDQEETIKTQLEEMRKRRDQDIKLNHNPLNVKNITGKTQWEVMKEKNMFKNNGNIFTHQKSVLGNNKNLFKNNMRLMRG